MARAQNITVKIRGVDRLRQPEKPPECPYCGAEYTGYKCPGCATTFGDWQCQDCKRDWPANTKTCWDGHVGCGGEDVGPTWEASRGWQLGTEHGWWDDYGMLDSCIGAWQAGKAVSDHDSRLLDLSGNGNHNNCRCMLTPELEADSVADVIGHIRGSL